MKHFPNMAEGSFYFRFPLLSSTYFNSVSEICQFKHMTRGLVDTSSSFVLLRTLLPNNSRELVSKWIQLGWNGWSYACTRLVSTNAYTHCPLS